MSLLDFEALLRAAGEKSISADIAARAHTRFASRVTNALLQRSAAQAQRVYLDAEALPSLTTELGFALADVRMDGPLYADSPLSVGYRGLRAFVVKPVASEDVPRLTALLAAISAGAGGALPHVAPLELLPASRAGRVFALLPRYADTLERMPPLRPLEDAEAVGALWAQLSTALAALHALGFAHGDVKPANACLDGGVITLVDLDSAARFGEPTATTPAYLPLEERPQPPARSRASARADWWALAMTLAEKACGDAGLPIGRGGAPRGWAAAEVRALLGAQLPAAVWAELQPRIAPV
jgi:hypothetical protein